MMMARRTRGPAPTVWTPDMVSEVRTLAEQGLTCKAIAARIGSTYYAVAHTAQKHKIRFHGQFHPGAQHPENQFYQARVAKGLDIFDASEKIGVCEDTIRRWERGMNLPMTMFIRDCAAEVYGVDPQELVTDEEMIARDNAWQARRVRSRLANCR